MGATKNEPPMRPLTDVKRRPDFTIFPNYSTSIPGRRASPLFWISAYLSLRLGNLLCVTNFYHVVKLTGIHAWRDLRDGRDASRIKCVDGCRSRFSVRCGKWILGHRNNACRIFISIYRWNRSTLFRYYNITEMRNIHKSNLKKSYSMRSSLEIEWAIITNLSIHSFLIFY